jgi:hypothetical protein
MHEAPERRRAFVAGSIASRSTGDALRRQTQKLRRPKQTSTPANSVRVPELLGQACN